MNRLQMVNPSLRFEVHVYCVGRNGKPWRANLETVTKNGLVAFHAVLFQGGILSLLNIVKRGNMGVDSEMDPCRRSV